MIKMKREHKKKMNIKEIVDEGGESKKTRHLGYFRASDKSSSSKNSKRVLKT